MMSDLPHTLYNFKSEDNKQKSDPAHVDVDDDAIRLNEESMLKSRARRKKHQQEQGYTIDEIFNGAADED